VRPGPKSWLVGDAVAFRGSDERYGKYICRRAVTLGCEVVAPLKGVHLYLVEVTLIEQVNVPFD
jgi:hypothetical protein